MTHPPLAWKPNWDETRERFVDWWNHEGLLVYIWQALDGRNLRTATPWFGPDGAQPPQDAPYPGDAPDMEAFYTQPAWRAHWNHYNLSRQRFPADTLPVTQSNIGPGSLALYLGGEATLTHETVWYEPCIDPDDPEGHPPLRFDAQSRWWRITEAFLRESVALGRGKYLIGCPDLIENMDIVAALRDPQRLMMDMLDRPGWVVEKVWEVNEAFYAAYDRVYDIIAEADGSVCYTAFRLWGPGKMAKVQCDASAMFSTRMMRKFVIPALTAQCEWLDYSMYHLDGHQCIRHLDAILEIEALDAVEWTPDPTVPQGGDPAWYPMYRKILEAGKSVQVVGVRAEEVGPLLNAVGGQGMYIHAHVEDQADLDQLLRVVEGYR